MAEQMSVLKLENDALKSQLDDLRKSNTISVPVVVSPVSNDSAAKDLDPSAKVEMSYHDIERSRSLIISGVSKLSSACVRERVSHDFQFACNIMDFLGVECNPVAV